MPKAKMLDDTPALDAYMSKLEHPLKTEIEAIRGMIRNAHPGITEGVKWNAPSFYYKGDLVVIHVKSTDKVHLIFPAGVKIPDGSGLLEGNYPDGRKMAYLSSMPEVDAKKAALENIVRLWVQVMDQEA